jgi:hypothetical protein
MQSLKKRIKNYFLRNKMGDTMRWLYILLFLVNYNVHAQSLTAENIFNLVNQSVVIVSAYNFYGVKSSQGSGVSIGNGIIITNYHVFMGNDSLVVEHYGRKFKVSNIIGADIKKDVLVLRLEDCSIPGLKYNDSISYKIGNKIYAIGSPYGYENSISEGIISGLRTFGENENYIQISAGIDHGSSGGAVVSESGKLIGISTFKDARAGSIFINFAIPIDYIFSTLSMCDKSDSVCEKSQNAFLKAYNSLVYYQLTHDPLLLQKSFHYIKSYIHMNGVDLRATDFFDLIFKDRPYKDEFIKKYEPLTQYFSENQLRFWKILKKHLEDGTYRTAGEVMAMLNIDSENTNYYYFLGQMYNEAGNRGGALIYFFKAARLGDVQSEMLLKKWGYIK